MKNNSITVLGIMSGTSLDGLDLALCEFNEESGQTNFYLKCFETVAYDQLWKERLQNAFDATAEQYFKLHSLYGNYIAKQVNEFLKKNDQSANYIASHGHTVFHRPELAFTTQIGCGATIAAQTGIDTICDFRNTDVALKGQGAPLVPIGDIDLFSQYESCLNIGGIANISFKKNNDAIAFDVCIANMALNFLSEKIGHPYDKGGLIASEGLVVNDLLNAFLDLKTEHKSLGKEWFDKYFLSLLENNTYSIPNQLATCIEYIALKISDVLKSNNIKSVLITGGGVYNHFLISRLKFYFNGDIKIPSDEIIQFKEAIIFGYLGYLRIQNKINTLSSVTEAIQNSCGGALYKATK